jgi:hypothetical protein
MGFCRDFFVVKRKSAGNLSNYDELECQLSVEDNLQSTINHLFDEPFNLL